MSAHLYAKLLLDELGAPPGFAEAMLARLSAQRREPCAAADWARSGALSLVGFPGAAPCLPTAPLPTAAAGAAHALAAFLPAHMQLDGACLLSERAALEGLTRQGRTSPGGSCRLLPARDGLVAVNMPRGEEDFRLLPAWLGVQAGDAPWRALSDALAECDVEEAVSRARLLGLAVAPTGEPAGAQSTAASDGEPAPASDGACAGAPAVAGAAASVVSPAAVYDRTCNSAQSAVFDGACADVLSGDTTAAKFTGASSVVSDGAHAAEFDGAPAVAGAAASDGMHVAKSAGACFASPGSAQLSVASDGEFATASDGARAGASDASPATASDGVSAGGHTDAQSAAISDGASAAVHTDAQSAASDGANAAGHTDAQSAASDGAHATRPAPWLRVERHGARAAQGRRDLTGLRVLDLSALWAGPLCGQLLALAGAHVVKMESSSRPDAARRGNPRLFALLNGIKQQVSLDWNSAAGRAELARAFETADLVVEASRPRALRQLGFVAEHWLAQRPGRVWCSITGYGRRGAAATYAALGDDAAAAAGLCFCVPAADAPLFVGDAVADPLTGVHAALACAASLRRGGGELLDVSLCGVTARAIALREQAPVQGEVRETGKGFEVLCSSGHVPIHPPVARKLDIAAQRESAMQPSRNITAAKTAHRESSVQLGAHNDEHIVVPRKNLARNAHGDAHRENSAQQTGVTARHKNPARNAHATSRRENSAQPGARNDAHTTSHREKSDQSGAHAEAHTAVAHEQTPAAPNARAAS